MKRKQIPQSDRLDVLTTLIDAYEVEHYPMDPPDPIEAIKFRMEQQGLTRRDLEEIIGTRANRRGPESKARTLDRDDPPPARAPRHLGGSVDPTGGVRRALPLGDPIRRGAERLYSAQIAHCGVVRRVRHHAAG